MRRGCQTALGFEEFLLCLRCQRGCLGSNSLIRFGRIGGRQGSTAYRERFLQGSLWIPWHSTEIDWYFSAYSITLAIRARLIRIARRTLGVRAGSQEMCLFVQSHLLVALTQRLERAPGRCLELLRRTRRQAGLPTLSRGLLSYRLFRPLCLLLSSSRRDVHAVLSHRTLARLHRQGERRGDVPRVDEPKGYRRSCYRCHHNPVQRGRYGLQSEESRSPGTVKNETTKIFPEFGNEFNHLFRRNLADHFLCVPFGHFDDNLADTLIVAK